MAEATLSRVRTIYVGPVRLMEMQALAAGADTITGLGVMAASTSANRCFAITHTPLSTGAEDTCVDVSAVSGSKPTLKIENGGSGDNLAIRIWGW